MAITYEWNFGERNACPTSTHPKKYHRGNRVSRRTVVKELPVLGGKGKTFKSTSYVDHVVCAFCGVEHDQEWMPA